MTKLARPLLDADFLCAIGLLADAQNCHLFNAKDLNYFPCMISIFSTTNLSNASESSCTFCKWSLSFLTAQSTFSLATKKHGVEHHISTTGLLVYAHARCLESFKLAVVISEFAYMGE